MSKLGYFLVGMLAGAATLGAAAWAVTEYAGSDGASRLASLDDGCLGESGDAEEDGAASTGSACAQDGSASGGYDGNGKAGPADSAQPQPA